MVKSYEVLQKERLSAEMVVQVHDELVFDVPEKELSVVRDIVRDTMEQVVTLEVPVKVGMYQGDNWKDLK
jgi:DNA polymerase-1